MKAQGLNTLLVITCLVLLGGPAQAGTPGTEKWFFPAGTMWHSSPAIGADGTIYVGSDEKKLYAVKPDGTIKWAYTTLVNLEASPAIGADGTIYVGGWYDLHAIKPDGNNKWTFPTGAFGPSSPAIGPDGTIYLTIYTATTNRLFAVRPNGTQKWAVTIAGNGIPVIAANGTIYVGGGNNLYAFKPDGSQKWVFPAGGAVGGSNVSPAIGADGTIYVGSYDHNLYAIKDEGAQGTQKWVFPTEGFVYSPAIGADGTIYIGSADGKVHAVNPDGSPKWAFTANSAVRTGPAIGADGIVYAVSSSPACVYAIYPGDGTQKWACLIIGMDLGSSPVIGFDGTVYVGIGGGAASGLKAVYGDSPGLAASPWPMFHHDARHTGSVRGGSIPLFSLLLGD